MMRELFIAHPSSPISTEINQVQLAEIKEAQRRSSMFREVIEKIWKSKDLKIVLQTAVDEVTNLLKVDACSFLWYFKDSQQVHVVCERINSNQQSSQLGYYPLATFGSAATAIANGQLIVSCGPVSNQSSFQAITRLSSRVRPPHINSSETELDSPLLMGAVANLLVPVKRQNGWLGFIACLSDRPRYWSATEIEFIQLIAQQLEIAIYQAKLYEQAEKQAQRERLINQITHQTRQSLDLEKILTSAISQLLEALAVDRCIVHLVENTSEPNNQDSKQSSDYFWEVSDGIAFRRKHLFEVCREPFSSTIEEFDTHGPISHWIIEHRQPVVISDVTQDSRIGGNNQEYQLAQIKSSLVVPVQANGKLYAILYLNQCSQVRYWSKNDQELAQAVGDQLAISIQQAALYVQTRRQMERESVLRLISNQLRNIVDLKTTLRNALREVRNVLSTDRVVIYQFNQNLPGSVIVEDADSNWISIWGESSQDNCLIKNYSYFYQQGQINVVNDVLNAGLSDRHLKFLQQLQVRANLVVPILINAQTWGLLIVHECSGPRAWKSCEIELLEQVSGQLAIAIQQAELYNQAQTAARISQAKAQESEQASRELKQALQKLEIEVCDRKQAEEALYQKNGFVQLLQVVAVAANEASTSEEALQTCLEQICAYTKWPVGHVYLLDSTGELASGNLWFLENPDRFQTFRQVTESTRFGPGIGLPGRVFSNRQAMWIADVNKDANFPRSKQAADIGVKAGLAFPVLVGTNVVAVLEFFSAEAIEPDTSLLEVLANIGTQLGRVIEREKAEKALRESEARFKEQAQQLEQTLSKLQQTQTQLIQTEKMSSLGQMVAGIAHEINNPVNFIHGNLGYVNDYTKDLLTLVKLYQKHYSSPSSEIIKYEESIELDFIVEDLGKMLSSMKIGTERIRQIVLTLRNFSRLDEAEMKRVDIHEGIDSTLLILKNRLKQSSHHPEITVIKEYGTLPQVECYPGQLNQVFMNIIANAIDAIDDSRYKSLENTKPPLATIRICTENLHPDYITIRIADSGPGMTEDVIGRLFDPFFTTKAVGKGTGLGLSISYQIVVDKHGGSIKCVSQPGKGAEFCIQLPVQQDRKKSNSSQSTLTPSKSVISVSA